MLSFDNVLIKDLPNFFYKRFANYLTFNWNKYCCQHWLSVLTSAIIGIISHIGWNSFTHPSGCSVQLFSLLQHTVNIGKMKIPIYKLLQHGSSLIGMSFVGLFIIYRL
ncbi:DUF4184 family protein [Gilliamella apicola]|uniref:DUF4184 family protein n=1 Tax=Gilliamella sp. Imp1-1 TaxID=3120248 RepID=UPI002378B130|nr:DUF4184 family protein [Gilliamella apicola]